MAKNFKQPQCPSVGDWIGWHVHIMKYSAVKGMEYRCTKHFSGFITPE